MSETSEMSRFTEDKAKSPTKLDSSVAETTSEQIMTTASAIIYAKTRQCTSGADVDITATEASIREEAKTISEETAARSISLPHISATETTEGLEKGSGNISVKSLPLISGGNAVERVTSLDSGFLESLTTVTKDDKNRDENNIILKIAADTHDTEYATEGPETTSLLNSTTDPVEAIRRQDTSVQSKLPALEKEVISIPAALEYARYAPAIETSVDKTDQIMATLTEDTTISTANTANLPELAQQIPTPAESFSSPSTRKVPGITGISTQVA